MPRGERETLAQARCGHVMLPQGPELRRPLRVRPSCIALAIREVPSARLPFAHRHARGIRATRRRASKESGCRPTTSATYFPTRGHTLEQPIPANSARRVCCAPTVHRALPFQEESRSRGSCSSHRCRQPRRCKRAAAYDPEGDRPSRDVALRATPRPRIPLAAEVDWTTALDSTSRAALE